MREIIVGLRTSMNLQVQDVENFVEQTDRLMPSANLRARQDGTDHWRKPPVDSTFGTVDLGLSSDHSSAGNSPLPTDPPLANLPEKHFEAGRTQPLQGKPGSFFEIGTWKNPEKDKDDDVDSAIGNSESHPLTSAASLNKKQSSNNLTNPKHAAPLHINTNSMRIPDSESVPKVNSHAHQKRSLGEEIQLLHKKSNALKMKDQAVKTQHDGSNQNAFRPIPLDLSETVDSTRLDTPAGPSEATSKKQVVTSQQNNPTGISQSSTQQALSVVASASQDQKLPPPPPYPVAASNTGSGDRNISAGKSATQINNMNTKDTSIAKEVEKLEAEANYRKAAATDLEERKKLEELDRLRLHREQQQKLLLEQQRQKKKESESDRKKQAGEQKNVIASQVKAASLNVHEKVQEFLDRMKNDDKFQISLSSPTDFNTKQDVQKEPSTMQMNFTGSTIPDAAGIASPSLTESRFRQGLEASLDYSGASDQG